MVNIMQCSPICQKGDLDNILKCVNFIKLNVNYVRVVFTLEHNFDRNKTNTNVKGDQENRNSRIKKIDYRHRPVNILPDQ